MPGAENFHLGFGKLAEAEKKLETEPHLVTVFEEIVEARTAGSPMSEKVRWTNLREAEIVRLFEQKGI